MPWEGLHREVERWLFGMLRLTQQLRYAKQPSSQVSQPRDSANHTRALERTVASGWDSTSPPQRHAQDSWFQRQAHLPISSTFFYSTSKNRPSLCEEYSFFGRWSKENLGQALSPLVQNMLRDCCHKIRLHIIKWRTLETGFRHMWLSLICGCLQIR